MKKEAYNLPFTYSIHFYDLKMSEKFSAGNVLITKKCIKSNKRDLSTLTY